MRGAGRVALQFVGLVVAVFWCIPLFWTLLTAFKSPDDPDALTSLFAGLQPSLQNFAMAWQSASFASYYLNTIVIVVGILVVQCVFITLAGFAFARFEFRGKNILFTLFLLQLMVPASALIGPNYTTVRSLGLLDTKVAVMLPYVASAMGTFWMRQTFRQVPRELEEAAVMDGARWWQVLWHVYLPAARPALSAFALVSLSIHWNDFLWPLVVTNTPKSQPLTVGLSLLTQMGETGAQWSMIAAGTWIVILPLLVLFLIFQRQFVNSFLQSGLK
ncbi:carbohydrate ABC transporter permease [Alicyclobacillus macrosporangiidus]|uniref:carbohydrate ABC transporter permease n=1 Tax=Alicyclobacillus macrosporangiidus TaxID=392015 RepID=UPI00068B0317|nr:carbohydrate ABC transporter permease [Alicyclobacillus macrosporangiidus]